MSNYTDIPSANAYYLGIDDALTEASASVVVGDEVAGKVIRNTEMVDELFHRPNLSGVHFDGRTSATLYREVTGEDFDPESLTVDQDMELMSAICDAYEAGVDSVWHDAIQARALRTMGYIDAAVNLETSCEVRADHARMVSTI